MRNVTIRLDESVLTKCRHAAVDQGKWLSQWIADPLARTVSSQDSFAAARVRALARLETGFDLGGSPLSRGETHER
jgi:hypothetical protein